MAAELPRIQELKDEIAKREGIVLGLKEAMDLLKEE